MLAYYFTSSGGLRWTVIIICTLSTNVSLWMCVSLLFHKTLCCIYSDQCANTNSRRGRVAAARETGDLGFSECFLCAQLAESVASQISWAGSSLSLGPGVWRITTKSLTVRGTTAQLLPAPVLKDFRRFLLSIASWSVCITIRWINTRLEIFFDWGPAILEAHVSPPPATWLWADFNNFDNFRTNVAVFLVICAK